MSNRSIIQLTPRGERLEIEADEDGVTMVLVGINGETEVSALPQFAAVAANCLLAAAGEVPTTAPLTTDEMLTVASVKAYTDRQANVLPDGFILKCCGRNKFAITLVDQRNVVPVSHAQVRVDPQGQRILLIGGSTQAVGAILAGAKGWRELLAEFPALACYERQHTPAAEKKP